ncbi:S8 family serine peptidase [Paenibacillus sp. strain BS8-2]
MAVVDSGVDVNHPMLSGRVVPGYDFVADQANPQSAHIHGTHVSGIVVDGTPEQVKIMPIRVLDDDGTGEDFTIARGIVYAVEHGADIINLSLGGIGYSGFMDKAIDYALSHNVLVVAAAGNDSTDTIHYFPAMKQEIIVVSASNQEDDLASFSNYGDSVDIAAPGVNIVSSLPDNEYGALNGTSMAAPHISAAAALIKLESPTLSPSEMERTIRRYSDDLGLQGWDRSFGEGIVQLGGYVHDEETFKLISPLTTFALADQISVKYYSKGLIGNQAIIKLGDRVISSKPIRSDGFQTESISLEGISEGVYDLSVEITDKGGRKAYQQQSVQVVTFNTHFEAFDLSNNKVENFHVELYGIKQNISFELGWLYTKNYSRVRTNLDFQDLSQKYDKIIAVVNDMDNLEMPVYIREVLNPGKIILRPEDLQSVEFSNNLPGEYNGYYGSIVIASIDGERVITTGGKTHELGAAATFYIDRGMHQVVMGSYGFQGDYVLAGIGSNKLSINQSNSAIVNTYGPKGINPAGNGVSQGRFDDDQASISFQQLNIVEHLTSGIMLNEGKNATYLIANNYRVLFQRSIKKYDQNNQYIVSKDVYMYRDIHIDNGQNYEFRFGGELNVNVKLDYTQQLSGFLNINDRYGNSLIANARDYFYQFGPPTVEELNYSPTFGQAALYNALEQPLSEITFENPEAVLKPVSGGVEIRTAIDSQNGFRFHGNVPDGQYILYVDDLYDPEFAEEYPLINNEHKVTVKNGEFVHHAGNNHPPQAIKATDRQKVLQYNKVSLDLNTLFKDSDGDSLYYETSHGYIYNDTLYYDADKLGTHPILIRASDRIGGTAQYQLELVVWDGKIEIEEVDDIRVFLNGELQSYEQPPVNELGRVLVPFRAIFEALGASIKWDPSARKINAFGNGRDIELIIDQSVAIVNGQKVNLDVTAQLKGDRTFVPLRFVGEAFGADVLWDPVLNSVYINN